jgi:hypothetical protein
MFSRDVRETEGDETSNSGTNGIEFGRGFTESPAIEWSNCRALNIGILRVIIGYLGRIT